MGRAGGTSALPGAPRRGLVAALVVALLAATTGSFAVEAQAATPTVAFGPKTDFATGLSP